MMNCELPHYVTFLKAGAKTDAESAQRAAKI